MPKTKKGASGISLFKLCFLEKNKRKIPTIAPIQNAITTPERASEIPRSHPRLIAILASPSPIQVPFDNNQSKAKGIEIINPDKNSNNEGKCGRNIKFENKNKPIKVIIPKTRASVSGIILCFKS